MESIDDVRILKERIVKIDSILALIGEKQNKIKILEGKNKKIFRENSDLVIKNNELLAEIEKCEKMQEQKLLQECKKYAELERTMSQLQHTNQQVVQTWKMRCIKYKKYLLKGGKYYKNEKMKFVKQICMLQKTIKCLKKKSLNQKKYQGKENIFTQNLTKNKEINILQNILIKAPQTVEEDYNVDDLLNEMIFVPDLMHPFEEEIPSREMCSIQTQTTRSTVTRPVQTYLSTSEVALQCNLKEKNICSENTKVMQTQSAQTEISHNKSSKVGKELHSQLIRTEKEHMIPLEVQSQSIQTAYCHGSKETQTQTPQMMTSSSQTTGTIMDRKITLKCAVAALKRSRKTFTISNGTLMHYSKNSMSFNQINENLITRTVFHRLATYIDSHYGNLKFKKRRRVSRMECETKQLERNRELMQMCRQGLTDFAANSDTDGSNYVTRFHQEPRNFDLLDELTIASGDSGIMSEVDGGNDQRNNLDEQDIANLLDEVLVDLPDMISPLLDDGLAEYEQTAIRPTNEINNVPVETEEVYTEIVETKQKTRKRPVNRLAMLKKNIKKCNKINITRLLRTDEMSDEVQFSSNKRKALNPIPKSADESRSIDLQFESDGNMKFNYKNIPESSQGATAICLKKSTADQQFQVMKQKSMNSKENSDPLKQSTNAEVLQSTCQSTNQSSTYSKPHLKASDILALLPQIETPHVTESMTESSMVFESANENDVSLKEITSQPNINVQHMKPENLEHSYALSAHTDMATVSSKPKITNIAGENIPLNQMLENPLNHGEQCKELDLTCCLDVAENVTLFSDGLDLNTEAEITNPSKTLIRMSARLKAKEQKRISSDTNEMKALRGKSFIRPVTHSLPTNSIEINNRTNRNVNTATDRPSPICDDRAIQRKRGRPPKKVQIPTNEEQNDNTQVNIALDTSSKQIHPTKEREIFAQNLGNCYAAKRVKLSDETKENQKQDDNACRDSQCTTSESDLGTTIKPAKKVTFRIFKTTLDKCMRLHGYMKLCQGEVQLLKDMHINLTVNFIIQYLKADQGKLEKSTACTSIEPLLTIKQKVVIGLLMRIENEKQTHDYINQLITDIEKHLLFNPEREEESLQNMARFYIALCRLRQKKHKVRAFLADLLYIGPLHKFSIIYTITTSWLNVLRPYNVESLGGLGIDSVLFHIVMMQPTQPLQNTETNDAQRENCIGVMKNLLVTYYKFPNEEHCKDDLIMSLLESYMCSGHVQFESAILILCAYCSNQWTYEKIQLISELCKVSIDEEVVHNLLKLVANIAKKMLPDYKEKVNQFLQEFILLLEKLKPTMKFEPLCLISNDR